MFLFLLGHCDFDAEFSHFPIVPAKPIGHSRKGLSQGTRKMKIKLDYQFLGNPKDKLECHTVGQKISWSSTKNYACKQEDILNSTQIKAIKGTFDNVAKYLSEIFSVDPLTYTYTLRRPSSYFSPTSEEKVSNVDLHITILSRARVSEYTLASASSYQYDVDTGRPIQGGVYINPLRAPVEIQGEHTPNNKLFYTYIHEIFHVMGISDDIFSRYHPRGSKTPHKQVLCNLTDPYTNKHHTILVTPYAHKFAVMQWGETEFRFGSNSCPSGIPLEDGGGSGTVMSHPEGRIAHSDLMTGISSQRDTAHFNRFTPLTMAILLDTGFYEIDYRKIQPLMWGNKKTTEDGNYIKNFVLGAPDKVFPQQYIYRPNSDPYFDNCGFNFKYHGGLSKMSLKASGTAWDCNHPDSKKYRNTKAYCTAPKFYNANNNDEIGTCHEDDFQILHYPNTACGNGEACISGGRMCTKYTIAPDEKSFTIKLLSREPSTYIDYECNSSNVGKVFMHKQYFQEQRYYKMYYMCPPIKQFINSVRMYENEPYLTYDPFKPKPTPTPKATPKTPSPSPRTPKATPKTPTPKTPTPRTPTPKTPTPKTPTPKTPEITHQPTQSETIEVITNSSEVPNITPEPAFLDMTDFLGTGLSTKTFLFIAGLALIVIIIISITICCVCACKRKESSSDSNASNILEMNILDNDFYA